MRIDTKAEILTNIFVANLFLKKFAFVTPLPVCNLNVLTLTLKPLPY